MQGSIGKQKVRKERFRVEGKLNLGDIFRKDSRNVRTNETPRTTETMSRGERVYRAQSEIRSLTPGQTIQGSVVSRDGTAVQIALGQDLLINARIEQSINLALGQLMSFEVKSNNGSMLSLAPLYANMANEATIMRALSAAGMPETANNVEMVAVMMEEGMPIDRESLAVINRLIMEFPTQNPATLIQMTRLGLPVTELNIEQFELYQNVNHQLLGSVETIMNELPEVFRELMSGGQVDQAYALYGEILDLFTQEADGTVVAKKEAQTMMEDAALVPDETNGPDGGKAARQETAAELKSSADEAVLDMVRAKSGETTVSSGQADEQPVLTDRQWNTLGNLLKDLGVPEELSAQVRKGQLSPKEVLTLIRQFMPETGTDGMHTRAMERLLEGKEFENLLKAEMGKQWLIEPKDVADPHKVEQLYERIREQSMRLNEALQAAGKADTPVARSVQNLQNNVDFMNQLNHMFTYVQLPLKMAGNQAHGDLYVYTNKKSLASKDGNVSALLHLDMEHLGALDIYVAMHQNNVSTNFTLQDESALDLIEQHIGLLNDRLMKRGYDLKAQFQVKSEEDQKDSGIMQTILNQGKNISVLSRTSFDMRA